MTSLQFLGGHTAVTEIKCRPFANLPPHSTKRATSGPFQPKLMRHGSFLLVLVLLTAIVVNCNGVVDSQIMTTTERLITNTDNTNKSMMVSEASRQGSTDEGSKDERMRFPGVASKFRSLFRENSRVNEYLVNLWKNSEVVTALKMSPVAKKLATNPNYVTSLKNNPEEIKKLVNDPAVGKIAVVAKKTPVKVTTRDVNNIRTAVAKDPTIFRKLKVFLVSEGIPFIFSVLIFALMVVIGGAFIYK